VIFLERLFLTQTFLFTEEEAENLTQVPPHQLKIYVIQGSYAI